LEEVRSYGVPCSDLLEPRIWIVSELQTIRQWIH
jgi:hypothetical protein